MTTAEKVNTIRDELNAQFTEREDAVDVLVLGLLTGQHSFLLGPPGTAKSKLAREFASRVTGSTYFETVLSKNRPDQAVLGPWDLNELRDHSNFVRKDKGFLTTCDIVFLDEIGKASPTLGHDLLAALNERVKHQVFDDRSAHPIPLWTAITASNELPAAESEDAAALWDRLLLRAQVDYIKSSSRFKDLLTSPVAGGDATVSLEEIRFIQPDIDDVVLEDEVLSSIVDLRTRLQGEGLLFSDRRWRESMRVVKAQAWLNGRTAAIQDDLLVLSHVLWDTPEVRGKVERTILLTTVADYESVLELEDLMIEVETMLRAADGRSESELMLALTEVGAKLGKLGRRVKQLSNNSHLSPRAKDAIDGLKDRMKRAYDRQRELLGAPSDLDLDL